jgi:hypothetical protein
LPEPDGPITASHKKLYAEYLEITCPCMEVDTTMSDLANKLCGKDT